MAEFQKHFTVDEANALLPELRELLEAIRAIRADLIVDLEGAVPVLRQAKQNGGGAEAARYLTDLHRMNARLGRVAELGVQIKDVERGLVDFPSWRGDREVLLCWHLGEAEVAFWHDLESGFAGRQAL